MKTNETNVDKLAVSSCDRYEEEVTKQFSGVLTLVLSILLTVAAVIGFINVITTFSKSILLAFFKILPFVFYLLATIGMWKVWSGAKKNDKQYINNLGMAKTLPKYQQIMAIFTTILVTISVFLILVFAKSISNLTSQLGNTLNAIGGEDLTNLLNSFTSLGMGVIALFGIVAIVYSVFTVILYAKIHGIAKSVMVGYNRKEMPNLSLMFPAVLCFIVCLYNLISAFLLKALGAISLINFIVLAGIFGVLGVMLILFNNKYKEIK